MQDEITIDATDLIHFLRRGLLLALAIGGIAGFAVLQLSLRQDPVYEAEASVLAAQTVPEFRQFGYSLVTAPPLDPSAYAVAGRSDPVLIDALSRMGVNAPTRTDIDRLRGRIAIRTEITRSSSLINVRGRGTTPEAAANRANAVANALVAWDKSRSTESLELLEESIAMQIESISEQIRSLQTLQDPAVADQITGLISLRAQRQQDLSSARTLSASATSLLQVL